MTMRPSDGHLAGGRDRDLDARVFEEHALRLTHGERVQPRLMHIRASGMSARYSSMVVQPSVRGSHAGGSSSMN